MPRATVTKSFCLKYNKEIKKASLDKFDTYAKGTPREILAQKAREELGYSENSYALDIWLSIFRCYRQNLKF